MFIREIELTFLGQQGVGGVACNILEEINGEKVIYKPSREEEKRARESWDEGDKNDAKRKSFSPENSPKILKRDKPLRQPAYEKQVEKHDEKPPRPQHDKMWSTLRESVDIGELSKRTLDAPVPGVTVRELLSISPDLIQQWFGVKRVPPLKGKEPDAHA